jgi:hypothetical protein
VNLDLVRYQEDAADITAGASAWCFFRGHDFMVRVAPRTVNGSKPREVRRGSWMSQTNGQAVISTC